MPRRKRASLVFGLGPWFGLCPVILATLVRSDEFPWIRVGPLAPRW
jgi:hypothetical protein